MLERTQNAGAIYANCFAVRCELENCDGPRKSPPAKELSDQEYWLNPILN